MSSSSHKILLKHAIPKKANDTSLQYNGLAYRAHNLTNCTDSGVGNIIYTIRLTQKYMVIEILLCGLGSLVSEGHLLFPKARSSDNTSLYIRYTRLRWTARLQADLHT